MEVDYLKLSEQYASFLVAVGGVSITVFALVLSFGSISSPFLVSALIAATVSCFTGAHMMAETAAFISHSQGRPSLRMPSLRRHYLRMHRQTGERLFLLASINIFIAMILLIFALMLLPAASGRVNVVRIKPIPVSVFAFVIIGALYWMFRSAVSRMPAPRKKWRPVIGGSIGSVVCGFVLFCLLKEYLLQITFITILFLTLVSLIWFAWTFKDGGKAHETDIWLFTFAITFTCVSLMVATIQSYLERY